MLWILSVVGGFGTVFFFLFTIMSMVAKLEDHRIDFWQDVRNNGEITVIFLVIGFVGLFGLAGIEALSYEDDTIQTDDWELVSLTDNSQISGNASKGLIYVNVSIDTEEVYSFYYRVDDGIKRGTVKADDTIIYEKDEGIPHIVEYTTYTKNKMNKFLRIILAGGYGESIQKSYKIYIPKGTVSNTYDLDSQ